MASNAHSPKSPSQMVSVQQHVHNASSQANTTQPPPNAAFRLNLDSSEQIPIMHQNGGSTTGTAVTSLQQATPAHVPSAMSTSLHSSSSTATGFDATTTAAAAAAAATSWNSTSSLSPTISSSTAQHHRKLEVKLNAMPYVTFRMINLDIN